VTWLNPWALIGLAGVAAPVLIHLLARGHARTRRFPSLRFLEPSQLLPTRRTRIHDPLLLGIRCGVVALAALALAQPLFLTARRKLESERGVARAIVLDTSASMRRATAQGSSALDSARRVARTVAGEASASIVVETAEPARALDGAVAWLGQHAQRAEVVVISDFQRGQVDSSDVRAVPADVSLVLHRVPVAREPRIETQWSVGERRVAVRATPHADGIDAEWLANESVNDGTVTLLGAEGDRAALAATRIGAATVAVPLPKDTTRAVAVVFPGYANRRALESTGNAAYAPWMVDLLRRLNARGTDLQRSAVVVSGNRRQLVLFTDAAPGSPASARIVADANLATSVAPPLPELEPETLSDAEVELLQRTTRTGSLARSANPNGASDARWFWLSALLLLALEIPLRRRTPRTIAPVAAEPARAA